MKRYGIVWLIAALLVVGCGNKGVTVTGSEGEKVSVNPTTGDMTITGKDGKKIEVDNKGDSWTAKSSDGAEVKFEDGKVSTKNEKGETFESGITTISEADLGLPFYPGSKEVEYGSSKMETNDQATYSMNRSTSDTPEKVVEFYKDKFTDPQTFNSSASGTAQAQVSGKLKDGSEGAVIAIRDKGESETKVMITVQRKKAK